VAVSSQDNEITQAQPLLEQLNLNGIDVTGDAMFTQRRVCEQIINQGGNYLFEVKNNQSRLKSEIARLFLGA
jgi:predicted transposase YbfD/YdcC